MYPRVPNFDAYKQFVEVLLLNIGIYVINFVISLHMHLLFTHFKFNRLCYQQKFVEKRNDPSLCNGGHIC
jgi:hypothetical protein